MGCTEEDVLSEDKFISVYVDLLINQDTLSYKQIPIDSIKALVFTKHDITEEQYYNTLDKYNSSPEEWEAFFDKALLYAEELKTKNEQ